MIYLLLNTVLWAAPQDNTPVEGVEQSDVEESESPRQEESSTSNLTKVNTPMPPKPIIEIGPPMLLGTIDGIEFSGRRRLDEFILRSAIDLMEGDILTSAGIRQAIVDIYETGYIEHVRVEQLKSPSSLTNTSKLIFHITEKPAISSVSFSGNKKLNDESIEEVLDINEYDIYNATAIQRNIQAIRDKYIEKGYYLVEIDPVIEEIDPYSVSLVLDIKERQKVIIRSISFTGNQSIPDKKLRRYMQTRQAGPLSFLGKAGNYSEEQLEMDTQMLRSALMEEGYADAKISKPQIFLSIDKRSLSIEIPIEEGVQYKIGNIKLQGDFVEEEGLTKKAVRRIIAGDKAKDVQDRWKKEKKRRIKGLQGNDQWAMPIQQWLDFRDAHPPMETGDVFKLSSMQITMQEIVDYYGDQGYAFVNVVPLTNTDPESGVLELTFDIRKGPKMVIGRIDITGNDPTFDKVVRREIPINEGDLYSGSALTESRARLSRLGFFDEININTPRDGQGDELIMKVDVSEKPTGSFSVGAGFSNLENFMFNANISKNNFLGLGYTMSVAANISSVQQQGNLQLFDPYFLDSRWTLRVHGYSIARQFIENEYQRGGSLAVGRYLDKRDDIRLEFDYTFENTGLSNIDAYKQKIMGGQLYRNGLTSTAGVSFVADKRNNRIQATQGLYVVASANLSGGLRRNEDEFVNILGGEFNFFETRLNLRLYQPLIQSQKLIFKYNMTIGHLGSTDGSIIPYIHRYRAGGINSIRGYNWFSLGPFIRATGNNITSNTNTFFNGSDDPVSSEDQLVVGGTETFINNFEIESPILPSAGISLVTFFDAGNAFGDPWGEGRITFNGLRMAYGGGVRWVSPMGPLRFELGFPINRYENERNYVFDFSMGSFF